jgi:hypothetical protein
MCKQVLKNGLICKKSSNKDYCHLHKKTVIVIVDSIKNLLNKSLKEIQEKDILLERLQIEWYHATEFNNIIINENNEIKDILIKQKNEIKNLKKTIFQMKSKADLENKKFSSVIEKKTKELYKYKMMESDYNKYQTIKNFSLIKDKMKEKFGKKQPYKVIQNVSNKDKLENIFKMDYENILPYYNDLRQKRIAYAH